MTVVLVRTGHGHTWKNVMTEAKIEAKEWQATTKSCEVGMEQILSQGFSQEPTLPTL